MRFEATHCPLTMVPQLALTMSSVSTQEGALVYEAPEQKALLVQSVEQRPPPVALVWQVVFEP